MHQLSQDAFGYTPLHWAAARGHESAVVSLLLADANAMAMSHASEVLTLVLHSP